MLPWLIGFIYLLVTGREGLGLGDSKLLAVVGALLGWRGVVVALFGGSVIGSVLGSAALLAARRRRGAPPDGDAEGDGESDESILRVELPFGPFLAMAAVFYVFAAPWIQLQFRLPGG